MFSPQRRPHQKHLIIVVTAYLHIYIRVVLKREYSLPLLCEKTKISLFLVVTIVNLLDNSSSQLWEQPLLCTNQVGGEKRKVINLKLVRNRNEVCFEKKKNMWTNQRKRQCYLSKWWLKLLKTQRISRSPSCNWTTC